MSDTYKICMYYQYVPGDYEDTYYPGEDKLWLEILLDAYRDSRYSSCPVFVDTIDANGIEAPLSLLDADERQREEYAEGKMDEIAEHIAAMLVWNGVGEYSFDECSNFKTVTTW